MLELLLLELLVPRAAHLRRRKEPWVRLPDRREALSLRVEQVLLAEQVLSAEQPIPVAPRSWAQLWRVQQWAVFPPPLD